MEAHLSTLFSTMKKMRSLYLFISLLFTVWIPNWSYSICGDSGAKMICKEWGYPDIGLPIALTASDGNEVIFLDYSECGKMESLRWFL